LLTNTDHSVKHIGNLVILEPGLFHGILYDDIGNKVIMANLNARANVPVERVKEQIKYATETLRWYVVIFVALVSGELNLLFKDDLSYVEYFFRNSGALIILCTVIVIFYHNRYIYTLIKKIK